MQNAELRMQNCSIFFALRAACGGCAPKRACGRSPAEMISIVGGADTIILHFAFIILHYAAKAARQTLEALAA